MLPQIDVVLLKEFSKAITGDLVLFLDLFIILGIPLRNTVSLNWNSLSLKMN